MIADALHLAVAADLRASAGFDDVGCAFGDRRKVVFLGTEPLSAATHH